MTVTVDYTSEEVALLFQSRIRTYLRFASSAVFVYDYLLTLGREITFIWPSGWSIVKVLYFLTRYSAFADVVVALYYHLNPKLSAASCKTLTLSSSWLLVLGIAVAEVILILRTWAVWNRDRYVGTLLVFVLVLSLTAACILEGIFLKSLTFMPSPSDVVPGCILTGGNSAVSVDYVIIIVVETGEIRASLVFRSRSTREYSNVSLTKANLPIPKYAQRLEVHLGRPTEGLAYVLYRDGLLYYIYPLAISIANLIAVFQLPSYSADLLTGLQRVLHSSLTARVIINLRQAAVKADGWSRTTSLQMDSAMVFADGHSRGTRQSVELVVVQSGR